MERKKWDWFPRMRVLTREIQIWLSQYPEIVGENEELLAWSAISSDQNWHQEWNLNQIHLIRNLELKIQFWTSIVMKYKKSPLWIPNKWQFQSYWPSECMIFSRTTYYPELVRYDQVKLITSLLITLNRNGFYE
jgi:hypothetical protein